MHPEFELIDRVARAMTEAEPPRDFRVRVIEKLPSARPAQPWWQYAAVACSGLALGVLIMVSMKPAAPSQATSRSSPAAPSGTRTPVVTNHSPSGATPISTGRSNSIRPSGSMVPIGPLGPVGPNEGAFQILSITPIQPSDLSIAPIIVGPLTVTGPLTMSPVGGGGRQK